ncbi:Bbp16 family capsid cement protein, partial [Mesorhizobium sp.]|uniref:Bbp16 family capsid cement protein n=1 Tax=Mesorhizobium sp. TaxID=1871066 RepID=UPI0012262C90
MIFDMQTLLSDAQAITATAASTNTIDLGPIATGIVRDIGKGKPIPLRIQVVEAFNNLTSLTIALQVDDNSGFASPKTVWSQTVVLADLIAGKVIVPEWVLRGTDERYMRLNYTVTGTAPTTGKIT